MSSERLKRGSSIINQLMENGDQKVLKGLGKIAPDLGNYILEFIFGDLYIEKGWI